MLIYVDIEKEVINGIQQIEAAFDVLMNVLNENKTTLINQVNQIANSHKKKLNDKKYSQCKKILEDNAADADQQSVIKTLFMDFANKYNAGQTEEILMHKIDDNKNDDIDDINIDAEKSANNKKNVSEINILIEKMGFKEELIKKALSVTGCGDIKSAIQYILEHQNIGLQHKQCDDTQSISKTNNDINKKVLTLNDKQNMTDTNNSVSIGFTVEQSKKAMSVTNNNVNAVNYLSENQNIGSQSSSKTNINKMNDKNDNNMNKTVSESNNKQNATLSKVNGASTTQTLSNIDPITSNPAPTSKPAPMTSNHAPMTSYPAPTSKPVPMTSNHAPITSYPAPTSKPVPITSTPVPTTSKPVPMASYPVPITSKPVPTTSKPVPMASYPVPMASNPSNYIKPHYLPQSTYYNYPLYYPWTAAQLQPISGYPLPQQPPAPLISAVMGNGLSLNNASITMPNKISQQQLLPTNSDLLLTQNNPLIHNYNNNNTTYPSPVAHISSNYVNIQNNVLPSQQGSVYANNQNTIYDNADTIYYGTCKRFDGHKGCGFIERDDGSDDIFVHIEDITAINRDNINETRVGFKIGFADDGRHKAVEVWKENDWKRFLQQN